ncbi:MAG: hypothetical protein JRI25_25255, partial [Deltaproteobacteria bacterium]|nr:hypothetical protein [Deltaproteobacteria bacterium]
MRRSRTTISSRIVVLATVMGIAGFAAACGDDGNPNPNTVLIVASQGGTVSMDGDETAINIPAGALT